MTHPGHGQTDATSWRHYLTEPEHILAFAAVVVLVIAWLLYRRLARPQDDR